MRRIGETHISFMISIGICELDINLYIFVPGKFPIFRPIKKRESFDTAFKLDCPLCARKMQRRFYSLAYGVEVDVCIYCGIIWFDKDELEILQYMVEQSEPEKKG